MNSNELYLKAANFFNNNQIDDAKKFALKAINKDKNNSASLNLLGSIAFINKEHEIAKNFFEKAIIADKLNSLAYNNLGKLFTELKNYDRAQEAFMQSISLSPNILDPYFNVACLFLEEKKYSEAKEFFLKTLDIDSSFDKSYLSLGIIEKELKNYDAAIMYLTLAIKYNLGNALAFSNLANTLFELEQFERAKAAAFKSIELDPNSSICYSNLAIILNACGDTQNAAKCLQKAYELEPDNKKIATNFALTLLSLNDYKNGLKLFRQRDISRLVCDKPVWNGEDLSGKTVVVYAEQGLGDTINFARFLTKLNASKVYFIPQDALLSLFEKSSLNINTISKNEFLHSNIEFDYHCALFDIMDICQIDKPIPNINFINCNAKKQAFFNSFLSDKKLKIGIAWQGNKNHINDKFRSCKLSDFSKIATLENVQLVSLQKDVEKDEILAFKNEHELLGFSDSLTDFEDTASLIASLDMVICIDTSVAHIAATLNKPVWLLCHINPDWRWHALNNAKWYDSVTIYKKQEMLNWADVFSAIIQELKKIQL